MTQQRNTCRPAAFAIAFTILAKRLSAARAMTKRGGAIGAVLVLAVAAEPATALTEIGPSSSASISISVSIAPKYGLKSGSTMPAPGRLCLTTNAQPTALPIMLVEASSVRSGDDANQLPWCESGGIPNAIDREVGTASKASALFIIRPE